MTTTQPSPAKELKMIASNYINEKRDGSFDWYVALYKDDDGNIYHEDNGSESELVNNNWGSHVDADGFIQDYWLEDLEDEYNSREAAVLFAGFVTNGEGKFRGMVDAYLWESHCLWYDLF